MTYTAAAKKFMLNALVNTGGITHVGAFDASTTLTAVTGVTSSDTFTKNSHGMANGTPVLLSGLTGGSGLVAGAAATGGKVAGDGGRVYFVVNQATNTFQLAVTPGGSAVDLVTDVSAVSVTPFAEISGGSPAYARKAIAFNAAADPGTIDDSTNGAVFDIPAAATVDAIGAFSASTAGTLYDLVVVVAEAFAAQGTYTVNDYDLDLLGVG